jgi:hypothetical protein
MKCTISNTYSLVWVYKNDPKYQFTSDGICINVQSGRIIRKVIVGGSKGFCLNGKFISISKLKTEIIKPIIIPF